jgi:glycosyltransferase involved in cell wall biosynthesis
LFAASPLNWVKNFELAKESVSLLKDTKVSLKFLENVDNENVPYYMNAADVILLTSRWEGSPNVIKEAMRDEVLTSGRENIDHLREEFIAGKLIELYNNYKN